MKILIVNAGSSSLKYQLIDMQTEQVLAKGLCERIGIGGHLKHSAVCNMIFASKRKRFRRCYILRFVNFLRRCNKYICYSIIDP